MQWSLEKIYRERVRGNVPPRKHLSVLGEETRGKKPTDDVQAVLPGMEDDIDAKFHVPQSDKDWAGTAYVEPGDFNSEEKLRISIGRALRLSSDQVDHNGFAKMKGDDDAVNAIATIALRSLEGDISDKYEEAIDIFNDIGNKKINIDFPKNKKFNWVDFVANNHPSKYIHPARKDFIDTLSRQSAKGSVNVGWPELAGILFLSDTTGAKKGDLQRGDQLIEVKATEARMGKGSPTFAMDKMKKILQGVGLEYEEVGSGSKTMWETFKHSLDTVNNSDLGEGGKRKVIMDLLINGTPKKTAHPRAADTFTQWASNKDIEKLVKNEEILKYIFATLQILYYRNSDGHNFDTLWAVNNDLDSFAFDVNDETTFKEVFDILVDNFTVSKIESDGFYGATGITVNSKEAQDVLKIK